jgi:deoxyadenosine/deoxycytidine kinase
LKIAFIGTHGVGKTTLCFDLAARLKRLDLSVDLVKEVARRCPLPINQDTTFDAQAWIFHTQIAEEIDACSRFEAVICDRSVVDNYAYLVHRVGERPEFESTLEHWVRTYDGLFWVPVHDVPSFDGTRDTSVEFQREIDEILASLVRRFDVPVHLLEAGQRSGWIPAVLKAMSLPLEPPQYHLFDDSPA